MPWWALYLFTGRLAPAVLGDGKELGEKATASTGTTAREARGTGRPAWKVVGDGQA